MPVIQQESRKRDLPRKAGLVPGEELSDSQARGLREDNTIEQLDNTIYLKHFKGVLIFIG